MVMKKLAAVLFALALLVMSVGAVAETSVVTYESRGVQVPATVVTPDGLDSYPVVIMSHGHGGERETGFVDVAEAMAKQGIGSIRMDYPGCGESTESFQLNTLTNMEADTLAAIDYVKANLPVSKIGLFGYSMGGRIDLELLAKGTQADAVALLAPAADTEDLKLLFGGVDNFESMRKEANEKGFVTYTTIYGQVQELSKEWFADLDLVADCAADAAAAWQGPALVIFGQDDEAVNPAVSARVAELLNAETFDGAGAGHGYGFYSEDPALRLKVADAVANFFAANLK